MRRGTSPGECRRSNDTGQAGIAQLARARAFQARGRGFESRFPLQGFPSTAGHTVRAMGRDLQSSVPRRMRTGVWRFFVGAAAVGVMAAPAPAASPEAYRLNEAAVAEAGHGNLDGTVEMLARAVRLEPGDAAIWIDRADRLETLHGSPYLLGSVAVGFLIERHGMRRSGTS
jgi:hypothetical protein